MREFSHIFERIMLFPKMGRLLESGVRMIFCRHYRIIYQETDTQVIVLTVIHSRRNFPQPQ